MDSESNAFDDEMFCGRVTRYLDCVISFDDLRILSRELIDDARKRSVFAQMCLMRAALEREGRALKTFSDVTNRKLGDSFFAGAGDLKDGVSLEEPDAAEESNAAMSLEDALILPALTEAIEFQESEPIRLPLPKPPVKSVKRKKWWLPGLSSAAILLIGLLIWSSLRAGQHKVIVQAPPAPVDKAPLVSTSHPTSHHCAVVTASAAGTSESVKPIDPGLEISAGQSLHVESGAVELTLSQGTVVVLSGPTDIQVLGPNQIKLLKGSMAARVPVAAHGFEVRTPGMVVVDLGTEFGLHVNPGGTASDLHVFKGAVQATGVDASMRPVSWPLVVTAKHAVSHDQIDRSDPIAIAYDPSSFNQRIEEARIEVPTHGTGAGVATGNPDPAWQVVSVPGDPQWTAKPAFVLRQISSNYNQNTPQANWISVSPGLQGAAPGVYVYQTSIDLTGFDEKTVASGFTVAVDDSVSAVKVNDTAADFTPDDPSTFFGLQRTLSFSSHAWHPGLNKVTVVVLNRDDGVSGKNFTGIQLSWTLTAHPAVKR